MSDRPPLNARVAAWLALVATVVAGALLVRLLSEGVVAFLIVFVCLAVAGAAAWIALSQSAAIRWLAVALLAFALTAAVVVFALSAAVDEFVAFVVACVVFALASRTAIRASLLARKRPGRLEGAVSVNSPAKTILIMNPKSGGGKVERFDLINEAASRGIETILLEPGKDLRTLAIEAAGRADVVGMAGGDGSQALVAEIAARIICPTSAYLQAPAITWPLTSASTAMMLSVLLMHLRPLIAALWT